MDKAKDIVKVRIFTKDGEQITLFLNKKNYLEFLKADLEFIGENKLARVYIDYDVSQVEINYHKQLKDFKEWEKKNGTKKNV